MNGFLSHIKILLIVIPGLFSFITAHGQHSLTIDISPPGSYKRVLMFNTRLRADSLKLQNATGKQIPKDYVFAAPLFHKNTPEFSLYETGGSALVMDTGGNLYMRDLENPDAKPIPLKMNIDTVGLGKKDIMIECSDRDPLNLVIYVFPASQYKVTDLEPKVTTKITIRLEELIYGAKGKVPPRLLDLWKDQVRIDPDNRRVLYDFTLILPKDMVKRGEVTLMIYDLSNQVVAIYPNLKKTENVIKRDNIMTNTYIYKVYLNGTEEVKKGLIHYLSPENEEKKLEQTNKKE